MALDPEFVQRVEAALKEVSVRDVGPITAERPLAELGLDSVSLAELLVVLEDKLDVSIDDKDLVDVKTFGDLEAMVKAIMAREATPPPE